jgi:hypothetical protein
MMVSQQRLFDFGVNEPATVKSWSLTKIDDHTVNATHTRTGTRHTIRASSNLFSPDGVAWDIPADLPVPVREAASKLLELACN